MAERPAVSVIIPAYNGEEFLRRCLNSVFSQTLKSLQVICVNDGSTDGTEAILSEYQRHHPDLVVITQANGGLSAARNAGLLRANGEYIDFLDCDDWLQEDALERLYKRAIQDSLDMLFYDGETIYDNEELRARFPGYETLYRTKARLNRETMSGEKLFVRLVDGKSYRASACMYLIRLDFLLEHGFSFMPGVYYEDNVFTLQCLLSAQRAGVDATPYYKRSMRDSSIVTVKKNFRHARSYYICQNALQHLMYSRPFPLDVIRCAQQQITSLMRHALQVYGELTQAERNEALIRYPDAQLMDAMMSMNGLMISAAIPEKKEEEMPRPAWMGKARLKKYTEPAYQPSAPFVSVVVPVYNAAEYLEETIRDLQGQTLKNFEMIFVDDGSTDESCKILEHYAKKDLRIRILHQENQYAGVARNHGMDQAQGEYLLVLDSDDRFSPELLTHAYACAKEQDAQIVLFHADLLQMPEKTYAPAAFLCPCQRLPQHVFSGAEGREHIFDVLNPWTKLFKRAYIQQQQIRYQSLFSSNDLYFSMIAMACAERIAPLPEVLVHYRVGQTNNIQSQKSKAPLDVYEAFCAVKEELIRRKLFELFNKPFAVKAAESMLRSLDTMSSLEGVRKLYEVLHDGGLKSFGVEAISKDEMKHVSYGEMKMEKCSRIMQLDFDAYLLKEITMTGQRTMEPAKVPVLYSQELQRLQEEVLALRQSYAFRIGSKITRIFHGLRKYIHMK